MERSEYKKSPSKEKILVVILEAYEFIRERFTEGRAKIKYLRDQKIEVPIILVPIQNAKIDLIMPKKTDILIDDDIKNINDWKNSGGTAEKFNKSNSLLDIFKMYDKKF